jgi:cell division protein FtsQ
MTKESRNNSGFNWRKLGIALSYVLLVGLVFTLSAFSTKHQQELKCWKIEVKVEQSKNGEGMVAEEEIQQFCNEASNGVLGKSAAELDIPAIRRGLLNLPFLKSAEVYPTLDGRCRIEVKARNPIARVIDSTGVTYYLDEEGYVMPLKDFFVSDLPVFVGAFRAPMLTESVLQDKMATAQQKEILEMAQIIQESEVWNAQVDHFYFSAKNGWMMIPRVGKNVIRIETAKDFKKKMENLFVFYSKAVPHIDLDSYDTLDTRFINQIVGIKRNITL